MLSPRKEHHSFGRLPEPSRLALLSDAESPDTCGVSLPQTLCVYRKPGPERPGICVRPGRNLPGFVAIENSLLALRGGVSDAQVKRVWSAVSRTVSLLDLCEMFFRGDCTPKQKAPPPMARDWLHVLIAATGLEKGMDPRPSVGQKGKRVDMRGRAPTTLPHVEISRQKGPEKGAPPDPKGDLEGKVRGAVIIARSDRGRRGVHQDWIGQNQ